MGVKKVAIVCEGKDISYGFNLFHLLQYKSEKEMFTCDMLGDSSVELYSAEAFKRADVSEGTIRIFVNPARTTDTSYTNVFQKYGMNIMQSETGYILKADDKQLSGQVYEAFLAYANEKRKAYFSAEKVYIERIGTCDSDWISKEFKKVSSGGLYAKKSKRLQQQYDCLSYVLYSDFLKNAEE